MPELDFTGLEKADAFNYDGLEKATPELTAGRVFGRFVHTVAEAPALASKMSRSFLEAEDVDALDEKPSKFVGEGGYRPILPLLAETEQLFGLLSGSKRTGIDDVYDTMDIPAQTRVTEKANKYAEIYPEREAFKKAVIEEKKAENKELAKQMKAFEQHFEMPEEYKQSSGFLEDVAGGLGTSVSSMVAGIAGTMLGGPGVGFLFSSAIAYSQMHGYKIKELEDIGGVSSEDKLKAGIISGGIQAPLEAISNLFMISKVMKLNGTWAKFLVSTLEAGTGEAVTEFVQQYPDSYASVVALNPDLTGSQQVAHFIKNIDEITGEALYSAYVGGATGMLTVGLGGVGKVAINTMLDKFISPEQKAINEAKVARFEHLADKFEKNGITESEAAELREMVNATKDTEVEEIVKAVKKQLLFQEPIKSETRDNVIKSVRESGKFTDEQVDSYATLWDGIARNWAELEPGRKPEQWYDTWLSGFETDESVIKDTNTLFQVSMDYVQTAFEENEDGVAKRKAAIKDLENRLTELQSERSTEVFDLFRDSVKTAKEIINNPEATEAQRKEAVKHVVEIQKTIERMVFQEKRGAMENLFSSLKIQKKDIKQYKISPPDLNPDEISELARDVDYGVYQEAIGALKAKGKKLIDGYHVTGVEGKDDIENAGIKKSDSWYGREEAVYFFADPDDIRLAIPYLAMKVEGDQGGDVVVAHFQIPVDDIKHMEWDGFFNVGFETYSAFALKKDISADQITDLKIFNIPSAKDYKRGVFQEGKRGAMENLFNDSPKIMHAFEDADPSTPIHETGHVLLEMMFRGGHEDYLVAAEWAGVEHARAMQGTTKWSKEELETFAKGFETYLMEGKAPTSRLAEVFKNLKTWLLEVYKSVKALGVELNPEIREVFDRWVSTESERKNDPILEVPGWLLADDIKTDMKRRELTEDSSFEDMQAEARKRVLGALKEKRDRVEKDLQKEFRKDAREMVNENPIYEMLADARKRGGFSYAQIVNDFGLGYVDDIVKRLPGLVSKNGVAIDTFAAEYGYETADDMMQAILNTQTKQQAEESHYNVLWRGYEAMLEHENINAYEDVIDEEINILNEMLGGKPKARKELKGIIRKQTGQIKDQEYQELKAGIKHDVALAKKAFSAGRKDAAKQQLEKTKQRLKALRNKVKIRDARHKIDQKMKRIWKSKLLPEYKAQITQILSTYYNIPKSYVLKPEMSLDAFLAEKEHYDDKGKLSYIEDDIAVKAIKSAMENMPEQRRNKKGYRIPLTLEEKQAMMQPVLMLNHLGRTAKILLTEQERTEIEDRVRELTTRSYEVFGQPEGSEDVILLREKASWFKNMSEGARTYLAMTGKLEFIFDILDGGGLGGPNAGLFETASNAFDRELSLGKTYSEKIRNVFSPIKKIKNWASKVHRIEGVHIVQNGKVRNLTKEEMMMIALQSGSKSGRNALITGNGFSEQQIDAIVKEIKDQGEWHMVEGVWDVFESLYPMLNNVHKQLTGVSLPRVDGRYFPLKYDAKLSRRAGQQAQREAEKDLMHAAYTRPTVAAGHRIARVAGAKPPVLLSLGVINTKLSEMLHDISHQVPVRDLQKILTNKDYRGMVDNTLGKEYYDQMMPWLAHIARPVKEYSFTENIAARLRANTTIVALGLKVSVSLKQAGSITQTVDELNLLTGSKTKGLALTARAVSDFYLDRKNMVSFINESSPMMDNRGRIWNRDLAELYKTSGVKNFGGSQTAKDAFFWMIQAVDKAVTYPSWYAGYLHGMDIYHGDHNKAVKVADKVVRKTQPVASPMDLSMFQRGGMKRSELMKWGTMFYTHFANFQNRMWQTKQLHKLGEIDRVEAYASYWWLAILPAWLGGSLAKRRLPEGWEWLKEIALYRLAGLPVIRDILGAAITGYDYTMTPVTRALKTPSRIAQIATSKGKDKVKKLFKETARLAGYIFGLPTDQALITMDGIIDLMHGGGKPQRLLFKKPYKEKKQTRRSL